MNPINKQNSLKFVLIGSHGDGKTSFLERFVEDVFREYPNYVILIS